MKHNLALLLLYLSSQGRLLRGGGGGGGRGSRGGLRVPPFFLRVLVTTTGSLHGFGKLFKRLWSFFLWYSRVYPRCSTYANDPLKTTSVRSQGARKAAGRKSVSWHRRDAFADDGRHHARPFLVIATVCVKTKRLPQAKSVGCVPQ